MTLGWKLVVYNRTGSGSGGGDRDGSGTKLGPMGVTDGDERRNQDVF